VSILALGFLLGMRHATDADHVIAMATIVSRERRVGSAAWIGVLWGIGHSLTIIAVGVAIIVFNWTVSRRTALCMEFGVGVMLVLLGIRNLRASQKEPHSHVPRDGGVFGPHRAFGGLGVSQAARPLAIGTVHGLAGSAAVVLAVLTTIREPAWAAGYLMIFGIGTIGGMVLITTMMAVPLVTPVAPTASTHRRIRIVTGLLSVCFGMFLSYKIGIVDGLFMWR
jgi:high-affinity nickel-transport protein